MPELKHYTDLYNQQRSFEAKRLARKLISIYRLKPTGAFRWIILKDERTRYKRICQRILDEVMAAIDEEELEDDAAIFKEQIKQRKEIASLEEWCCVWHIFRRNNKDDVALATKVIEFLDL